MMNDEFGLLKSAAIIPHSARFAVIPHSS